MALLLSIFLFLGVAGLVVLFGYRRYVLAGRVYENLEKRSYSGVSPENAVTPEFFSVRNIATAIARRLPASAQTASALQLKLMAAGYRDRSAVAFVYGLKFLAMAAIVSVMFLLELRSHASPSLRLMGILVGVIGGFRLPDYFLARQVTRRRKNIRKSLPDALDLIIVCAEAGLTID